MLVGEDDGGLASRVRQKNGGTSNQLDASKISLTARERKRHRAESDLRDIFGNSSPLSILGTSPRSFERYQDSPSVKVSAQQTVY